MKIGLLGGTFNPIHIGHLVLAQESWFQLALNKVVFVPACLPPHKAVEPDVSGPIDRLNMVRLALGDEDRFEVSTYEIDKGGTSYSIDTINYFTEMYSKDVELFFLAGADSVETLHKWKDIDGILSSTHFVVATRPGWDEKSPFEEKVQRISIPAIEVSSTIIRKRIQKGRPIDYLVPSSVAQYIRDKGLYAIKT